MNVKPGDKIIIIDPDLSKFGGEEWAVTKEPLCGRFFGPSGPDIIWVGPESGHNWPEPRTRVFLRPHQYKLVNNVKPVNDPMIGAQKRMNDNLRSIFE